MKLISIFAAILFFCIVGAVVHRIRLNKMAKARGAADICAYARSFDYRNVDTKIMRAVFEHVQQWAGNYEGKPFPVRADDDFDRIYRIDPEDLEDICRLVAKDLGIDVQRTEENPYYGKVKSVKELVLFLNHQSKANA